MTTAERLRWAFNGFFGSLNTNSGAVTAFATVALAVITGAYLVEVREQRMLNYAQLALQNRPALIIRPPSPFEIGDVIRTSASLVNQGGVLEELRGRVLLLCCLSIEEAASSPEQVKVLPWDWYIPRLGRQQVGTQYMGLTGDARAIFEPVLNDKSGTPRIFAYIRVYYTQPPSPVEASKDYRDSLSFWWNPLFRKWMGMGKNSHGFIEDIVESQRIFEQLERQLAEEPNRGE